LQSVFKDHNHQHMMT